jgi:hypothetical protein
MPDRNGLSSSRKATVVYKAAVGGAVASYKEATTKREISPSDADCFIDVTDQEGGVPLRARRHEARPRKSRLPLIGC